MTGVALSVVVSRNHGPNTVPLPWRISNMPGNKLLLSIVSGPEAGQLAVVLDYNNLVVPALTSLGPPVRGHLGATLRLTNLAPSNSNPHAFNPATDATFSTRPNSTITRDAIILQVPFHDTRESHLTDSATNTATFNHNAVIVPLAAAAVPDIHDHAQHQVEHSGTIFVPALVLKRSGGQLLDDYVTLQVQCGGREIQSVESLLHVLTAPCAAQRVLFVIAAHDTHAPGGLGGQEALIVTPEAGVLRVAPASALLLPALQRMHQRGAAIISTDPELTHNEHTLHGVVVPICTSRCCLECLASYDDEPGRADCDASGCAAASAGRGGTVGGVLQADVLTADLVQRDVDGIWVVMPLAVAAGIFPELPSALDAAVGHNMAVTGTVTVVRAVVTAASAV